MTNDTVFTDWLSEEIRQRGLNLSETARLAGLSQSTLSMVINGQSNPGIKFCKGIARAINVPLNVVLNRANLVPSKPGLRPTVEEIAHVAGELPEEQQRLLLSIARTMLEAK